MYKLYDIKLSKHLISESVTKYNLDSMNEPSAIVNLAFTKLKIHESLVERAYVIGVDSKLKVIYINELSVGTYCKSFFPISEIIRVVLLAGVNRFFVLHNHPTGNPIASNKDFEVTDALKEACALFSLEMVDHLIFCQSHEGKTYYSTKAEKLYVWRQP